MLIFAPEGHLKIAGGFIVLTVSNLMKRIPKGRLKSSLR